MPRGPDKDPRDMGGEELRTAARRQDKLVGMEIERIRQTDERFRAVLDRALALDEEIDRRRGKPHA